LDGYVGLDWTPDGRIICSMFAGRNTDLFSVDIDGTERIQLTSDAGQDNTDPSVSSDGRYIVFTSNRTGTGQIWRMDSDGRNQRQLTFGETQTDSAQCAAISPSGSEVFFIRHAGGPGAIWKVPIEGGTPVQVSQLTNAAAETFLSISPDGKLLAYRHLSVRPEPRTEENTFRIGLLPADGNGEPMLLDLPMRRPLIQWSTNGAFDY